MEIHKSTYARFRCLKYGIKRLDRIEKEMEERRKRKAKRYNKDYPGQIIHGATASRCSRSFTHHRTTQSSLFPIT